MGGVIVKKEATTTVDRAQLNEFSSSLRGLGFADKAPAHGGLVPDIWNRTIFPYGTAA